MCPTNGFLLSWLMARLLSQSINKAIRSRSYIKKNCLKFRTVKPRTKHSHSKIQFFVIPVDHRSPHSRRHREETGPYQSYNPSKFQDGGHNDVRWHFLYGWFNLEMEELFLLVLLQYTLRSLYISRCVLLVVYPWFPCPMLPVPKPCVLPYDCSSVTTCTPSCIFRQ